MAAILFQQVRTVTSFFTRKSAEHLWKTITAVSKQGMRKGRHKARKKPYNLHGGQTFGIGPTRLTLPGLNAPISGANLQAKLLPRDPDFEKELEDRKDRASFQTAARRKKMTAEVRGTPPLLRGYVGRSIKGRKLGPPPATPENSYEGFESVCVQLKRRNIMTGRIGNESRFVATVVVGNGNGLAGFATVEAMSGKQALNRAIARAGKHLSYIHRFQDRTIYHDFYAEKFRSRIFAKRAEPGNGLICHRCLKTICELVGIKDIFCKVEGTTKKYPSLVEAFFTGLRNQETFQHIAERKRLHVVEFNSTNNYMPRIVASPLHGEVKKEDELDPYESLDLDDVWGGGRLPWSRVQNNPLLKLESYQKKLFLGHPYRNQNKVICQLMKDGYVDRWTRTERHNWSKNEHEKVKSGEKPLPKGLGLTEVRKNDIVYKKK